MAIAQDTYVVRIQPGIQPLEVVKRLMNENQIKADTLHNVPANKTPFYRVCLEFIAWAIQQNDLATTAERYVEEWDTLFGVNDAQDWQESKRLMHVVSEIILQRNNWNVVTEYLLITFPPDV